MKAIIDKCDITVIASYIFWELNCHAILRSGHVILRFGLAILRCGRRKRLAQTLGEAGILLSKWVANDPPSNPWISLQEKRTILFKRSPEYPWRQILASLQGSFWHLFKGNMPADCGYWISVFRMVGRGVPPSREGIRNLNGTANLLCRQLFCLLCALCG